MYLCLVGELLWGECKGPILLAESWGSRSVPCCGLWAGSRGVPCHGQPCAWHHAYEKYMPGLAAPHYQLYPPRSWGRAALQGWESYSRPCSPFLAELDGLDGTGCAAVGRSWAQPSHAMGTGVGSAGVAAVSGEPRADPHTSQT